MLPYILMIPRSSRGFSLLEILIVVVAATAVLAIAVPGIQRSMSSTRLKNSAIQLASELSFARNSAVSRSATFTLLLDFNGGTFQIIDPADPQNPPRVRKNLDDGIQFNTVPGNQIRFFPRGNATAGAIQLMDAFGQTVTITVSPSGMVEMNDFMAGKDEKTQDYYY